MTEHLRRLGRNLPRNRDVRLRSRGKNRIVVTSLPPQAGRMGSGRLQS